MASLESDGRDAAVAWQAFLGGASLPKFSPWPLLLAPTFDLKGGVSGFSSAPSEFRGYAAHKILSSLGEPFVRWWTFHALQRSGRWDVEGGLPRSAPAALLRQFNFESCKGFQLGSSGVPDILKSFTENLGYTFDSTADRLICHGECLEGDAHFLEGLPLRQGIEVLGEFHEPRLIVPDNRDPSIYVDAATGGLSPGRARLVEWEANSDAECAVNYLRAYQKLLTEPTARNLREATLNPREGTDPYFLCMMSCFNQGLSTSFLNLLHVAFWIHYVQNDLHHPHRNSEPLELAMFDGLLRRYFSDHL